MKQPATFLKAAYWTIAGLAWFFFFHVFCRFHFYYLEQAQMFTADYRLCGQAEGLATYLTGCYVQHFGIPYAGPALLTGINLLLAGITAWILNRIRPNSNWRIGAQLVPLTLTFLFFNHLYLMAGTTAYLLALLALAATTAIRRDKLRLGTATVLAPILYFLCGPAALLFAFALFLIELPQGNTFRKTAFLLPVLMATGAAWWATYSGTAGSMRQAFLPDEYFHHSAQPAFLIYIPWLTLCFLILLADCYPRKWTVRSWKLRRLGNIATLCVVLSIAWQGTKAYGNFHAYPLKQITYYAQRGDWESVIELTKSNRTNYLYIAYRNLALSETGRLADDLFCYPQVGPLGLIPNWDKSFTISQLLSDIYYHIGDIALAQQMAFEGNTAQGQGGCPHLWKRLVETNLIFDAPQVARKYIDLLSRTAHYRGWAQAHLPFAKDPAKIEEDPTFAEKRRCLGPEKYLSRFYGIVPDLEHIAENNPDQANAIRYLGCLYLLGKDLGGFQAMLDKYYGTPVLPRLPRSFQEAVIILHEGNPEQWKTYRLSDNVIRRFETYRKTFGRNRQSPYLQRTLQDSFGDTYWYYFTFKK